MNDWIIGKEPIIRLAFSAGIFGLMAVWEIVHAHGDFTGAKGRRWLGNLGLVIIDVLVVRLLFPSAVVGMALTIERVNWGLFNAFTAPYLIGLVVSVLVFDLVIYLQHVMFHAVPVLWRFHMVHHADVDLDVSTSIRFHPIEILVSTLVKLIVVLILGPPVLGILIFEVLLNSLAMFNHAKVYIPSPLERILRWVIVTPDMHRIHHSVDAEEYTSNFGFNLSLWDRILGTYLSQPAKGYEKMILGLENFRESLWQTTPRMLAMPFVRQVARHRRVRK